MRTRSLIAVAALAALAGCVGTGAKNGSAGGEPLRMAVYVDKGARNIGAFRWLEIPRG